MEIKNENLAELGLEELRNISEMLETERIAHAKKTKLVNDLIARKEDALRRSMPSNPKGIAKIGK